MPSKWHESTKDLHHRASVVHNELTNEHVNPDKSTLYLVVTHGKLIKFWSQHIGFKNSNIDFCGLSAVSVKPKKSGEMKLKGLMNCSRAYLSPKDESLTKLNCDIQ